MCIRDSPFRAEISCQSSPGISTCESGMSWADPKLENTANVKMVKNRFMISPLFLSIPEPAEGFGEEGAAVAEVVFAFAVDETVVPVHVLEGSSHL